MLPSRSFPALAARLVVVVALATIPFRAPAANAAPASASTAVQPDSAPPRLAQDAIPTSESVNLTVDPGKTGYTGRVVVTLDVKQPVSELRFHARALEIDSATVRGASGPARVAGVERLVPDQALVKLASPLGPGACTLTIAFHNAYNTRATSLYRVVTGGTSYLFTQFEDTEAREAFPCWDEPCFKFPWSMTLTVPAGDLAVSNTPIVRETPSGKMKTVEFATTRPLPSYLIAIAVGPFETVPIPGLKVPGRVITVKGASAMAAEAARSTPDIIASLERYFGRPYPYDKLDLIAAPEFLFGAMENAGAVVFADRALLIDPRAANPDQRRRVQSVIAHELAHQWFGDLVTMKWWDDLWLNESFASWMAAKVMDDVYPETMSGTSELFSVNRAMTIDSRTSTRAMRQPVRGSTSLGQTANELTYNKGQAVLGMFEGWLGTPRFRSGVLEYLKAHEWGNAEGRDLWLALGHVSGDDVDAAMATFLDQPGVPLVSVEPLSEGRVRLTQRRFFTIGGDSADAARWRIPVILRYAGTGSALTRRVWLIARDTTISLGARTPAWIEPNGGAGGYYRWSVPDAMLEPLAQAAKSGALTPRERIDLIGNLTAQLRSGRLHGDRYLALLSTLANDASPEVVRSAVDALQGARTPLSTARSDSAYAAYVRRTLAPDVGRFGMRPATGEPFGVTVVRPPMLRLLAAAGHDAGVITYAESLGRAYRRDPSAIDPSLIEFGLVVGAVHGDRALFDDYRNRFENTTVPIERPLYLAGMSAFQDPGLRKAALEYAINGPLRPQEVMMIPGAMNSSLTSPEGRGGAGDYSDEMTQWMFDHFSELASKMPPNFSARIMSLGSGCSEERIAALRQFFSDPAHKVLGGDNTLMRLAEAIKECASLHDREGERVERWLLQQGGQP